MLKSLYFKLHDDNEKQKEIIDFFDQESKKLNITKMELLKICIGCYHLACKLNVSFTEEIKET